MKIRMLVLGLMAVFLSACAKQTLRPVAPVDWERVLGHVAQLTEPNYPQGPHQHRGETRTNRELWELSWQQELASRRDHDQMRQIVPYLRAVAEKARQVQLPPCSLWRRVRGVECDPEK